MVNISRVDNIAFESTHFYDDKKFNNYIVWLEGDDAPYRMTKCMNIINAKRDIPKNGDHISYTLDGYRLKNVNILYNVE